MISVLDGGLQTTVQDAGRFGLYHLGIPPSGALDDLAFRVANLLVGNRENAAALEATYNGPRLQFTNPALVAVTGAELPPMLDGAERPAWESFAVDEGQVLSFGYLRGGARAYIAVRGGIDVPDVLGSRSTYTLTGIGGFGGRSLREDDALTVGSAEARRAAPGARLDPRLRPGFSRETELRVVPGLCAYRLTDESLQAFFDSPWTVTPSADRVGYRYRGIGLEFVPREPPFGAGSDPSNVVDVGYPVGSIQIPGGVEPIVLLNDAVTGGGYATIGTIISADRDKLAQTKTPETTRFVSVTLEDALAARAEQRARLDRIRSTSWAVV